MRIPLAAIIGWGMAAGDVNPWVGGLALLALFIIYADETK